MTLVNVEAGLARRVIRAHCYRAEVHMRGIISAILLVLGVGGLLCSSGCASTGACVGAGGALSSPECKADWSESECNEWNSEAINGASWSYHAGDSCSDLGYTEECSDGSFREPGAC